MAAEIPIACDITVLSPQENDVRIGLLQKVRENITSIASLPKGVRLSLSDSSLKGTVQKLVHYEGECCPFLDFQIEEEERQLYLSVVGEEDVKPFLLAQLAARREAEMVINSQS